MLMSCKAILRTARGVAPILLSAATPVMAGLIIQKERRGVGTYMSCVSRWWLPSTLNEQWPPHNTHTTQLPCSYDPSWAMASSTRRGHTAGANAANADLPLTSRWWWPAPSRSAAPPVLHCAECKLRPVLRGGVRRRQPPRRTPAWHGDVQVVPAGDLTDVDLGPSG